ncbi:uncharacterized protein RJT21DRAFT_1253 [Scheffersomyces amazonensis]|uniref:uncharacterized protein n=1 Tax=Scheffersomyces amazonensis TaxID=1078765 RepID=UPI00315CE629
MSDPMRSKYPMWKLALHKFQARRDIPFRRKFFIGYDLFGNTYWEFTIDGNLQRLRRKMEPYKEQLFKVDYFSTVPPPWLQWLRRTRYDAPTLQELIEEQSRQERIKLLAQNADAKWYNAKLKLDEEQRLKLADEIARSEQEAQSFKQKYASETEKETEKEKDVDVDPWKQSEESKNEDPIQSTSIKPGSR